MQRVCLHRSGVNALLIVLLLIVGAVYAQNPTGTISGTVLDSSGAVVPSADVTATHLDTGLKRTTVTSAVGTYALSFLPVGRYEVSVRRDGFKNTMISGLTLRVQEALQVAITLQLGSVSETLRVEETLSQLDTQTASVGSVIGNEQVTDLPLNARNFLQLTYLSPFSATSRDLRSQGSPRGEGAPTTGGARSEWNNYSLDGLDNVEGTYHNAAISPPVDSVGEFRVQTGLAPAEFGRTAGTVINVVTKSGTNSFHGSLYEFHRNDFLDARNFFASQVSPLKRNQFGGSAGGPILRNKLLVFGNYEGYRERAAGSPLVGRVPTADERQGTFASTIRDPLTGQPFPGNQIPAARIDPISKAILNEKMWPDVNTTDVPARNFRFDRPSAPTRRDTLLTRGDYIIGANDNLYVRYVLNDDDTKTPVQFPNGFGGQVTSNDGWTVGGHYNRVISPTVVNDFSFGYTKSAIEIFNSTSFGEDLITKVGITNSISSTDPVFTGPPQVGITGYLALSNPAPRTRNTETYELADSLMVVRGKHQFKIGGSYRRSRARLIVTAQAVSFSFANNYSGNVFGDFLLGLPSSILKTGRKRSWDSDLHYGSAYIQDEWRVSPRLTLSMGLRYEVESTFRTPRHDAAGFDLKTGELLLSQNIAERDYLENFYRTVRPDMKVRFVPQNDPYNADTNNLAPRIGLAFQAHKRLSVRAGYGINYSAPLMPNLANSVEFVPNNLVATWTANSTSPFIGLPGGTSIPTGWNPEGRGGFDAAVAFPTPTLIAPFVERDFPYAYIQQWTLSVQNQIAPNLMLDTTYLGARGVHLHALLNSNYTTPSPAPIQPRLPYPSYLWVEGQNNGQNSYYHALGVKLEKRMSHGLMFLTSYTFSKSIDTASTLNAFHQSTDPKNYLGSARGISDFSVPHRLSAAFAYELPLGRNRRWGSNWNRVAEAVLGGWGIRGIAEFQSGFYESPIMGSALTNICANACTARPDRIADGNLPASERGINRYWDPAAFVLPLVTAPRIGNSGRNFLQDPGINSWDLGAYKSFRLAEGKTMEMRYEAFNAFNHTQFGTPGTNRQATSFGVISSARSPRISQVVLKIIW